MEAEDDEFRFCAITGGTPSGATTLLDEDDEFYAINVLLEPPKSSCRPPLDDEFSGVKMCLRVWWGMRLGGPFVCG